MAPSLKSRQHSIEGIIWKAGALFLVAEVIRTDKKCAHTDAVKMNVRVSQDLDFPDICGPQMMNHIDIGSIGSF